MFKKKIAFKLTASFVLIMLIAMLTIGILFIQMFRQYAFDSQEKTMLTRARSIAEVLAENSQNLGQIRGFGGTMHFLNTMTEANVWITDAQGNPSPTSGMGKGRGQQGKGQGFGLGGGMGQGLMYNSKPLPPEAEEVIQEVLKGNENVSENFSSVYNEATLTVGVPIIDSTQQVIGSVLLHTPITGVTATLNKAVSILAVSLLAALLLAMGLGIFFSMLFTRPLTAMNLTALEITRGNYSAKTGVNRQDELGRLSNSLDHLAMKLGCTINQLFREKGKLDDIISSISEGLVAFDDTLKPISANFALGEIMNRPQPYRLDSVEKDFKELGIEHQLKKVIDDKKPVQVLKDWLGKKLKFTVSPIIDSDEQVSGSVALVQDISQSARLEQLRRDFVANVSHEFRTPLTVIRGSVEALVDGTVENSEDMQRYHQRILSETRGLERLVGDLLELSRLQAGKILINKSEINISDLLEDTIKSLQTIANPKNIKIHYHSQADLPPLLGDYDRLRQLFVIFLDNAIIYSPDNTLICIESRIIDNSRLSILIRDQGYGIEAKELPHIWDRFYKADKSRQSHGTGLGLAIAKHLIDLHGGNVSINSELEKGTEIEVNLPLS